MRNKLAFVAIIALIISPFSNLISKVHAADVTAYIDLTAGPATAPSTVTTSPELAQSTADEFYISYVTSATQFAAANTITIVVPASFSSLATCAASTTDADGDATPDGSLALLGQVFTYTFSAVTTLATTTGVEICFAATTPAANGNYNISVSDDNDNDTSAALIYVGTAGADTNDVTVTATVGASISLTIKNPSTTANTNSCNLGSLNTGSVNTCAYRIAGGTNIASGMNVQTLSNGPLTSGGNTIDDVADGTVTAGSEEHGVAMTAGTGWTLTSPFNTGDDPITTTQQKFESRSTVDDDTDTTTWSTVTHKASISTSTIPGVYTQIVTYRAYALP